jgi:predicted transcriptional regulator
MESISTRTQFAANAGHRSGTYAFDTDAEYVRVGLIRLLQPIRFLHPPSFCGSTNSGRASWATAKWKTTMMIRIIASRRCVEIDEPDNFRSFSVRVEGRFDDPALEPELFGRVADSHDREHAWISERALREWPQLKSETWWQDGLTKMITAAEKFGWIDNANHSIRAHIDYLP